MKTTRFRISPIPSQVAWTLRRTGADDVGNRLTARVDETRHQCRSCLTLTRPWEPYLAVSYAPIPRKHAFAERGPIYIHERECASYESVRQYPAEFPRSAVVLRGYGDAEEIEDARFVKDRLVEDVIEELLANPRIRFLHARNATYGCFMFSIHRT